MILEPPYHILSRKSQNVRALMELMMSKKKHYHKKDFTLDI